MTTASPDGPLAMLVERRISERYDGKQAAFARAVGLSPAYVNHLLRGKITTPSPEIRRTLAAELGLRHADLLILLGELAPGEIDGESASLTADEQQLLDAYRVMPTDRKRAMLLIATDIVERLGDGGEQVRVGE